MSLALRIVIGWSIAIVVTIALWNLGFILAARRQRALEAEGARDGEAAAGGDLRPDVRLPRAGTADRRRARAG